MVKPNEKCCLIRLQSSLYALSFNPKGDTTLPLLTANIKQETTMTTLCGVTVITEAQNLHTSLPSCPHPGWSGQ